MSQKQSKRVTVVLRDILSSRGHEPHPEGRQPENNVSEFPSLGSDKDGVQRMLDPDLPLILGPRAALLKFVDESGERFMHDLRFFRGISDHRSVQSFNEPIQGVARDSGAAQEGNDVTKYLNLGLHLHQA